MNMMMRSVFWGLMGMVLVLSSLVDPTPTPDSPPPEVLQPEELQPTNPWSTDSLVCPVPEADASAVVACHAAVLADAHAPNELESLSNVPCNNGFAGLFPCHNIDLLSFLPLSTFDSSAANDIWGWTDPTTGREYALIGLADGTGFVDVTDPTAPTYLGKLPTQTNSSTWRDIKVYRDHAFVVADAAPGHGLQVFDLTQLRNVNTPPVIFAPTVHYSDFGSSHNLVLNEETGYAYAVGSDTCAGGLHIVDINDPQQPTYAGCHSADGYTHDAQCVIYNGPDAEFQGRELCFNANTTRVDVLDVTDKDNLQDVATMVYPDYAYTHQLWLTSDHEYLLVNDELDENPSSNRARTIIFDVRDLDNPRYLEYYSAQEASIDHNLYIRDRYVYQSNYQSGLRILDAEWVDQAHLSEVAYFDTYPWSNETSFNGAWSNYPFFESGHVIVSSIEQGLFVLQPTLQPAPEPPAPEPVADPTILLPMIIR